MLTDTVTLRVRLEAARQRERDARAAAARLVREMAAADKRTETQRLCTLGRAWTTWAEQDPRFLAAAVRFLGGYITRPGDRACLVGTPFELPEPGAQPVEVTSSDDGGSHGE
jgi:hypothetical protein